MFEVGYWNKTPKLIRQRLDAGRGNHFTPTNAKSLAGKFDAFVPEVYKHRGF